jgi:type II secretory pathway pseudopilin PulG
MTPHGRDDDSPGRVGFLEALVALALIGVLVLVTLPWLFATLNRAKLARTAAETREMIELARLQARKLGLRTHVAWDAAGGRLVAYADADLDGRFDPARDYPAGPPFRVPDPIELRGPGDAGPAGPHAIVGFEPPPAPESWPAAVFLPDGSAARAGAFRFADPRGNVLEVRVPALEGEPVVIRKWSGGPDVDASWRASGEGDQAWRWE